MKFIQPELTAFFMLFDKIFFGEFSRSRFGDGLVRDDELKNRGFSGTDKHSDLFLAKRLPVQAGNAKNSPETSFGTQFTGTLRLPRTSWGIRRAPETSFGIQVSSETGYWIQGIFAGAWKRVLEPGVPRDLRAVLRLSAKKINRFFLPACLCRGKPLEFFLLFGSEHMSGGKTVRDKKMRAADGTRNIVHRASSEPFLATEDTEFTELYFGFKLDTGHWACPPILLGGILDTKEDFSRQTKPVKE